MQQGEGGGLGAKVGAVREGLSGGGHLSRDLKDMRDESKYLCEREPSQPREQPMHRPQGRRESREENHGAQAGCTAVPQAAATGAPARARRGGGGEERPVPSGSEGEAEVSADVPGEGGGRETVKRSQGQPQGSWSEEGRQWGCLFWNGLSRIGR